MTMARAVSATTVRSSIHTYVHLSIHPNIICHTNDVRSLSQMNLGHIAKYHNVFFEFYNGLYCTMSSGVIALCS